MIVAYLKATNRCNVGCSHCYLPELVRANGSRMDFDVLKQTAHFLKDMGESGNREIDILWHGGEPLIISPEWYESAGTLLDEILPGHTESMQTSLIPFREEFVPLVKQRFSSFLGTSIDFGQRRLKGSVEAYHALFMDKVDLARSHGVTVVPGVVPSTLDLGREAWIVDWFVDRDFAAFNIDRYNAYELVFPDRPSNAQHSSFLTNLASALFERMERTGRAPVVGAIKAGITGVLYGVGGDRWGGNCMSDFVVVEPDGSLNNCPDKSTIEEPFGNVTNGYMAFAGSRLRRSWIRHQAMGHKKDHCSGCENQHFCKSGCPITPNGAEDGEDECSGYHGFLSFLRRFASTEHGRALLEAYIGQQVMRGLDVYERTSSAQASASRGACAA